jgi:hypothetical protein
MHVDTWTEFPKAMGTGLEHKQQLLETMEVLCERANPCIAAHSGNRGVGMHY